MKKNLITGICIGCVFLTPLIAFSQTIKSADKMIIAVFNFINDNQNAHLNILEYSLREKLSKELLRYENFKMVDQKIINERIITKKLDVRESINKPKILQYIGGLVKAEMLVMGDFVSDGNEIVITAQIIDATVGKTIRTYKLSGNLSNVDGILQRMASDIFADIETWKKLGGMTQTTSVAHRLGSLVADAEEELNSFKPEQPVKPANKIMITPYLQTAFEINLTITRIVTQEINAIVSSKEHTSQLRALLGMSYLVLATRAENSLDTQKAKEYFITALWFLPDNPKILLSYAEFYEKFHNYPQAIELYTTYIQKFPDDDSAYYRISKIYLSQEAYTLAIFFSGRGLTKNPNNKELYLILAEAYAKSNRIDKAIATLQLGMKVFPKDLEMGTKLSSYYQMLGQPNEVKNQWGTILNGNE